MPSLWMRRRIGMALWVLGAVVALIWGTLRSVSYEARGMGFSPPVRVASLESGRLMALDVNLHDAVDSDTVVARMDPGPLAEEREVKSAEVLAMQEAQAAAAMNEARRFSEGVESLLLDQARMRSQYLGDLALAESLREQLDIEWGLRTEGASSNQQVRGIERQLEVVEARIVAGKQALAVADAAASEARSRKQTRPSSNEWQVVAAARALEAIENRIERMDLSAGIDGQVTAIHRSPGEVLRAGETVMEITRSGTSEVVAWIPTTATPGLLAGQSAHVVRSTGQVLPAELVSVGGGPQPIPRQLWYNPAAPEWGIPVRLQVSGGQIGASEPVTVRL